MSTGVAALGCLTQRAAHARRTENAQSLKGCDTLSVEPLPRALPSPPRVCDAAHAVQDAHRSGTCRRGHGGAEARDGMARASPMLAVARPWSRSFLPGTATNRSRGTRSGRSHVPSCASSRRRKDFRTDGATTFAQMAQRSSRRRQPPTRPSGGQLAARTSAYRRCGRASRPLLQPTVRMCLNVLCQFSEPSGVTLRKQARQGHGSRPAPA